MKAKRYLQKRAVNDSSLEKFRVGYAPFGRTKLFDDLKSKGVTQDELIATGMMTEGSQGPSVCRFRDRVMFPITDNQGRVIAFGGRALDEDAKAKYLNSPETVLFKKRQGLFNYANARKSYAKNQPPIVVEGYTDVIAADQCGYPCAIAPLGTALTIEQLQLIWKLHDNPILCFDGDRAGQHAAFRALKKLLPAASAGKTMEFVMLDDGLDPDTMIKEKGAQAFKELIAEPSSSEDILYLYYHTISAGRGPEHRAAAVEEIRQIVSSIQDATVRRFYGEAFATKLQNGKSKPRVVQLEELGEQQLEMAVLRLCMESEKVDIEHSWSNKSADSMYRAISKVKDQFPDAQAKDVFIHLSDLGFAGLLADIYMDNKINTIVGTADSIERPQLILTILQKLIKINSTK